MDYDSTSSCDERLRDLEGGNKNIEKDRQLTYNSQSQQTSDLQSAWRPLDDLTAQPKVAFNINKSLSKQVMEYYKKYSQNSNLDQYFSLPESSATSSTHGVKYYYSIYELNPRPSSSRQDCVTQDYNLGSYVPRERRRWARPPLVGQSSNSVESSSIYSRPLTEPRSPSPEAKQHIPETIAEEKAESRETSGDNPERKSNVSPTSSVASHKPLEWDSGADVGYFNALPQNNENNTKLSTIERMALAGGCSAALRQDPEGTTESNLSNKVLQTQGRAKSKRKPDANSTPLPGNISETESEIEITPIVKDHVPGIIAGNDTSSEERKGSVQTGTPISVFKVPPIKYATEGKKPSILKKSTSMNILTPVSSKLLLKRSQSDLNIQAKDKSRVNLPLIFDSTSSLATVVNKPMTCDKVIQTTINEHYQESVGIQVSVLEEEKPPVPKRGTSLAQKSIHSILKTSKNTCKITTSSSKRDDSENIDQEGPNGTRSSSTDVSHNESRALTPHPDDTENITGRANSFEYFPGHVYENVPNGNDSHVSSIDTRRSNSTMPNTSSSIDEKLWGDSDSLVRDLERSVNILKSLVDANKCDKQVKKRLIHHVVKRLVTAKYTDDKIEHNLEENVPWNPDDARKKVYRTDIIQALTKKQNTTDSSEEWKPSKKKKGPCLKKQLSEEVGILDEMITLESSNSDKFDAQTDRTEMDGRKARMGLRTDDCQRSSISPTDVNKSESSECFLPHRRDKAKTRDNIFCFKENTEIPNDGTSTSDSPLDQNRIYLDTAADNRQSTIESSNGTRNSTDWRLPTTLSERQFELRRRSTSESGDSKLVSYAETEKKNQLLWITNEISHLSNLKKLLEQPKKLERPRLSPKKVKHTIQVKQKPTASLKCVCSSNNPDIAKNIQRSGSEFCEESINQQWSSHCNLAGCKSTADSNSKNVTHLKKRNSCTQTATEAIRAHSQTGGEIILTNLNHRNIETKSANIYVQTSSSHWESSMPGVSLPQIICPVHKNASESSCLCHLSSQKLSSHQNVSNVHCRRSPSPSSYSNRQRAIISHGGQSNGTNRTSVDVPQVFSHAADKENRKSEAKEAKNKVNATKSLCNCDCNVGRPCQCVGNCSCEIGGGSLGCKKLSAQVCKFCFNKIAQVDLSEVICSCGKCGEDQLCKCLNYYICEDTKHNRNDQSEKLCECPAGCKCGKEKSDTLPVNNDSGCGNRRSKSNKRTCQCSNECNCSNKISDKVREEKKCSNCCKDRKYKCLCCTKMDRKTQQKPHYMSNSHETRSSRLQNDGLCRCGKDCCCENKLKDIERRLYSPKRSARTNCSCKSQDGESNASNQQHCRSCGSMYQNGRKCSCRINYPKPIAYELSFGDRKPLEESVPFVNKNGRIDAKKLSDLDETNSPSNSPKFGGCSCEETKSRASSGNSARSKTLQEYLAQNKPDFVNNVETRQQCMFEISHLRELRREKRVQLLALASGSNLSKTPRVPKPKLQPAQRKISDEEMKERLRKRYLKLHEVRNKRQQREKQEQARRNKLMANIFCKKLQQKVLKGQVDLSNSVSVISNL